MVTSGRVRNEHSAHCDVKRFWLRCADRGWRALRHASPAEFIAAMTTEFAASRAGSGKARPAANSAAMRSPLSTAPSCC